METKAQNKVMQFRLSALEKQYIEARAQLNEYKNISEFIRHSLIYPQRIDKKRMLQMVYEVNKIGVNLNQIAYKVNKENFPNTEIIHALNKIHEQISLLLEAYREL